MKRLTQLVLPVLLAGGTLALAAELSADHAEARRITQAFAGELMPALKSAMAEGGPVNGIAVCNVKSPAIAHELFAQNSPWQVKRVSSKPRGANATPDAWEAETLAWFEAQLAGGADPATLERFAVLTDETGDSTRYMKPIMTNGLCLTCHGDGALIPPEVRAKLEELYPQDKATGYGPGELRGAFSLKK